MNAKKVILTVLGWSVAALPFVCSAVSITVDKVQQRYPYNGLVDIDYTLSYAEGEVFEPLADQLAVEAINRAVVPPVTNRIRSVGMPTGPGRHRVTWDANADGVNYISQDFVIRIAMIHCWDKYMVVDISNPSAETFPVTYVIGRLASSFNTEEFKGDKMVFRLVAPRSFYMGSPDAEPGRYDYKSKKQPDREIRRCIALTKPFYVGLFEVTQKQYQNVCGKTPSVHGGDYRPVENVSYDMLRGTVKGGGWPANDEVDEGSFFGILRQKTGLRFDLPTEAQWECACRAGTETPYSDGVPCATVDELATCLNALGRYAGNVNDETRGGYKTYHTTVGSFAPNGFGLYDMHGNVYEWCLDWWNLDKWAETCAVDVTDPKGPETGTYRIIRGGAWRDSAVEARSANRNFNNKAVPAGGTQDYNGFRVVLTLQ